MDVWSQVWVPTEDGVCCPVLIVGASVPAAVLADTSWFVTSCRVWAFGTDFCPALLLQKEATADSVAALVNAMVEWVIGPPVWVLLCPEIPSDALRGPRNKLLGPSPLPARPATPIFLPLFLASFSVALFCRRFLNALNTGWSLVIIWVSACSSCPQEASLVLCLPAYFLPDI